jgi:hypothetical protein
VPDFPNCQSVYPYSFLTLSFHHQVKIVCEVRTLSCWKMNGAKCGAVYSSLTSEFWALNLHSFVVQRAPYLPIYFQNNKTVNLVLLYLLGYM